MTDPVLENTSFFLGDSELTTSQMSDILSDINAAGNSTLVNETSQVNFQGRQANHTSGTISQDVISNAVAKRNTIVIAANFTNKLCLKKKCKNLEIGYESKAETDRYKDENDKLDSEIPAITPQTAKHFPKLIYEQNQWSPRNKEGKRIYSRKFMLALQIHPFCLKKPTTLRDVDCVKDNFFLTELPFTGPDCSPRYVYSSAVRPKKFVDTDNGSVDGRSEPTQEELTCEIKVLCEEIEKVLKNMTPENYHSYEKFLDQLKIDSKKKMDGVIDLILEKACIKYEYTLMYANLCFDLAKKRFGSLIRKKCWSMILKISTDPCLTSGIEYDVINTKAKLLGVTLFVAQLFKLGHGIRPKDVHKCIGILLSPESEVSVACLFILILMTGELLPVRGEELENQMDIHFQKLQLILESRVPSPKVRFLLQELISFKQNNWIFSSQNDCQQVLELILPAISLTDLILKPRQGEEIQHTTVAATRVIAGKSEELKSNTFAQIKNAVVENAHDNSPTQLAIPKEASSKKAKALIKETKNSLRELTLENFCQKIYQIHEFDSANPITFRRIVSLIIKKAANESDFSSTFAKLCSEVIQMSQIKKARTLFNFQFNNKFLKMITMYKNTGNVGKISTDELIDAKRKLLGSARFVRELRKLKIIYETFVHNWMESLITQPDSTLLECFDILVENLPNKQAVSILQKVEGILLDKVLSKDAKGSGNIPSENEKCSAEYIINALTQDNCHQLAAQFAINSKDKMNVVIDLLFKKVVKNPTNVLVFARFCQELMKYNRDGNFKRLLINKCRGSVIACTNSGKSVTNVNSSAQAQTGMDFVRTALFVVELVITKVVKVDLLLDSVGIMLKQGDEISLENSFVVLSCYIERSSPSSLKKAHLGKKFEAHFRKIQKLVDAQATSARIKLLLENLIVKYSYFIMHYGNDALSTGKVER